MPVLKWSDVVKRCDQIGLSRAEMARRAGMSESTVAKGVKRDSRLRGPSRRVIQDVLDEAERERAA